MSCKRFKDCALIFVKEKYNYCRHYGFQNRNTTGYVMHSLYLKLVEILDCGEYTSYLCLGFVKGVRHG